MKIIPTKLDGALIIEPDVFKDNRGFFMETYRKSRYLDAGIDCDFVQDNYSFSIQRTLRGLHYQIQHPQAKLVQVFSGEVFDVAIDIRPQSPTFAQWVGIHLSEANRRQFFIPEGFAHGFCVLSDTARFSYKCSRVYMPQDEGGILWSDPQIDIDWPISDPIVSAKDAVYPHLADLERSNLPAGGN
jgi:dTDP-4-dehydrorhamnose 3,5-epimerase